MTNTASGPRTMRRVSLGLSVTAAAVLACACGSGSNSTSAAAPSTATSSAASVAASSAAPASSGSGTTTPASGGSAAGSTDLQALYQQAVAAGQTSVVIYGPTSGSDQKEWAAFKQEFPKITVTGVPIVGPPMDAKLSAESTSGKHIGDIAYTGATNMLQYAQKGYFTSFKPALASGATLVDESAGPGDAFYGVSVSLAGTVTNSTQVKSPPKDYTDLEAASYKNKIAMYDPTAIGEQADIFAHLALDPKYSTLMSSLKANDVQLFPASSITGPLTAVAQGAKTTAIGVGYAFYQQAKASGAPVAFSLFDTNNYTVILYQGQLKGAPHPLAAQLYEDWMFTTNAAQTIAAEGSYSTVTGSVAPQGLQPLSSVSLQKDIPLAQIVDADNAAVTAAKKYWGG
jgi:iron(III) transport system substrate-binding protein